jgi:hypothetical protein
MKKTMSGDTMTDKLTITKDNNEMYKIHFPALIEGAPTPVGVTVTVSKETLLQLVTEIIRVHG